MIVREIWLDWRSLVVVFVVCFGVWGFIAKLGLRHMSWAQLMSAMMVTNAAVVLAVAARHGGFLWTPWTLTAVAAGAFAAVGSLTMYRALELAPASIVVPLSSLGVILTVLLSVAFLGETLSVRQIAGILCGIAAIVLLAS
jgi:uncharacterized membrane protein